VVKTSVKGQNICIGEYIIKACNLWNDTGLILDAGKSYAIGVAPGQYWYDAGIRCGPDGYDSPNIILRLSESMRRMKNEKWFALIGAIDHDKTTAFNIGSGLERIELERRGQLCCFANDVWFMYWNNWGNMILSVYALSPP
jgi:hypothetical protein